MPCDELRLFFGGLDGQVVEFRGAPATSTVAQLRARAAELLGAQADEVELWSGKCRLEDDAATLEATNLRDHATVRICKGSPAKDPARTELPALLPRPVLGSHKALVKHKPAPPHGRKHPVDSFDPKSIRQGFVIQNNCMTVQGMGTTAAVGVNSWSDGTVRWTLRFNVEGPQPKCYASKDLSHRYRRWGGSVQVGVVPDGQPFVIQDEQKRRPPGELGPVPLGANRYLDDEADFTPIERPDALEGSGIGWRSDGMLISQLPLASRAGKNGLFRQMRRLKDFDPSHELGVELSLASGRVRFMRDSEFVGDCSIGAGTFRLAVRALNAKVTLIDVARRKE